MIRLIVVAQSPATDDGARDRACDRYPRVSRADAGVSPRAAAGSAQSLGGAAENLVVVGLSGAAAAAAAAASAVVLALQSLRSGGDWKVRGVAWRFGSSHPFRFLVGRRFQRATKVAPLLGCTVPRRRLRRSTLASLDSARS